MTQTEARWQSSVSRRNALGSLGAFMAGARLACAQRDPFRDHSRVAGLEEMRDVFDFEAAAYERLDRANYNYTARGGGSEFTARRNRDAFDWVSLVPRVAGANGALKTSAEILGTQMRYPIMAAPSSGHAALHPDKEEGTYEGCTTASETPMILSHAASMTFTDLAKNKGGPLWFQLYARRELEQNREPCVSAQIAGAGAIVVTVDQQASFYDRASHDRNLSLRPRRPARLSGNTARYRFSEGRIWYEWALFEALRSMVEVPLLAKGLLTAEDAALAVEFGLDGIVVSNHGGRTLDYTPSTLEVLPEIVEAVAGRIPVLIDSGFRRGSDVLKALALGADAVCLGRVPRWGLGSFGAPGVTRVLRMVQEGLEDAMRLCGVRSLASLDRNIVKVDFP